MNTQHIWVEATADAVFLYPDAADQDVAAAAGYVLFSRGTWIAFEVVQRGRAIDGRRISDHRHPNQEAARQELLKHFDFSSLSDSGSV